MIILLFILLMFSQPMSAQSMSLSEPFTNGMPSDMNIQYGRQASRNYTYYRGNTHATPNGQRYGLSSSYFAKQKTYSTPTTNGYDVNQYSGISYGVQKSYPVNRSNAVNANFNIPKLKNISLTKSSKNKTNESELIAFVEEDENAERPETQIERKASGSGSATASETGYADDGTPITATVTITYTYESFNILIYWSYTFTFSDGTTKTYSYTSESSAVQQAQELAQEKAEEQAQEQLQQKIEEYNAAHPYSPLSFDVYAVLFFLLMCVGYVYYKKNKSVAGEFKNVA